MMSGNTTVIDGYTFKAGWNANLGGGAGYYGDAWKPYNGVLLSTDSYYIGANAGEDNGASDGYSVLELPFSTLRRAVGIAPVFDGTFLYHPRVFQAQGSNNGSSWTNLGSQFTAATGWTTGVIRKFSFTNNVTYKFYRLNITDAGYNNANAGWAAVLCHQILWYAN